MSAPSQQLAGVLVAWRWPLLACAVVLSLAAYFPARSLDFDRSIENMFATGDPVLPPYEHLKRTFGGNEVVLAVYEDPKLLAPDGQGIDRLERIAKGLKALPGVKDVISLDQPLGRLIVNDWADRLAEPIRRLLEGYTHSADGQVAAVVCILWPEDRTDVPRQETIDGLRAYMEQYPSGMIAGEPVMVTDGFRYVEEDGRRLAVWTTVLLAAVILLSFRSLRWVLVPVAVVQLSLLWTKAALYASGLRLTMVSSMLAAIVTVVGIAVVIHVIVRLREARLDGLAPREAMARTIALLASPVFWSIATTVGGFASLLVAGVAPVRDFGLMMALGTAVVLVGAAMLVPGMALAGRIDADPRRAWGEHLLEGGLARVALGVQRRPKAVALASAALAAAAIAGTGRLQVETDFTSNFRASSPIVRSYEFVETRLGGAGMWDVVLPAPHPLTWDYLKRVHRLEERLRAEVVVPGPDGRPAPGLTKCLSLADAVVAGTPESLDRLSAEWLRDRLMRKFLPDGLAFFKRRVPALYDIVYSEDPDEPGRYYLRIMLRSRERQHSEAKEAIIAQVRQITAEEFPPEGDKPEGEVTGVFVLLVRLVHSMLRDQWTTFGVATGVIALMMLAALRSLRLALIALVPNTAPILVVMGMMGWLGLKINMGAAMIAAVSIGLSIDSSIHYITSFLRARAAGRTVEEAICEVQKSVGRAMVFSIFALVVGFSVLSTSPFIPTVYFGALVSLAMLGGLAGNLVVLPVLLKLAYPSRSV